MRPLLLLRASLVLGRVSNLPTVWSNLLAGWCIAEGAWEMRRLVILLTGGSFLYIGGMYLNDFCDANFDRAYRRERPIPAGVITRAFVGWAAGAWLIAGFTLLALLGSVSAMCAALLAGCIIFYDVAHKLVGWAPWVMAICRSLLYLTAAGAAGAGRLISWTVLPESVALGAYIAGITYLARGESRPGAHARGGLLLLLIPGALALMRSGFHPLASALFLLLFCLWLSLLVLQPRTKRNGAIGRTVSGLLAGVALVDILAVAPLVGFHAAWLLAFFGLALLWQRVIPAT